jgi:hypothetical protein
MDVTLNKSTFHMFVDTALSIANADLIGITFGYEVGINMCAYSVCIA